MTDSERLQHALEIALEAGERIRDARHDRDFGHRYKDGQELVTDIDVAVDRRSASAWRPPSRARRASARNSPPTAGRAP